MICTGISTASIVFFAYGDKSMLFQFLDGPVYRCPGENELIRHVFLGRIAGLFFIHHRGQEIIYGKAGETYFADMFLNKDFWYPVPVAVLKVPDREFWGGIIHKK